MYDKIVYLIMHPVSTKINNGTIIYGFTDLLTFL